MPTWRGRAQNAMISGADTMIEALSGGSRRVEMCFSSDVEQPGDYIIHLHRVEHDLWDATCRVGDGDAGKVPNFRWLLGLLLAWLCNQTHRFICGEHPRDIYVHSISNQ